MKKGLRCHKKIRKEKTWRCTSTNTRSEKKFLSLNLLPHYLKLSPNTLFFRFSQEFYFLCSFPHATVLYLLPICSTMSRLAIILVPSMYIWLLPPTFLPVLVSALPPCTHELVLFVGLVVQVIVGPNMWGDVLGTTFLRFEYKVIEIR